MKITYLGHACFTIEAADQKLIIDPFIKASPNFKESTWDFVQDVNYILISHGHFDHVGDAVELSKTTGAAVVSNLEMKNWLTAQGVENCYHIQTSSVVESGVEIVVTPAFHGSSIALENGDNIYAGFPCGYVIKHGGKAVYHSGDTGLFGDMKLVNELHRPNVGLLPIGGRFVMSTDNVIYACNNFFQFDTIVPMHYNTFPWLAADPAVLEGAVGKTAVNVMEIGDSFTI